MNDYCADVYAIANATKDYIENVSMRLFQTISSMNIKILNNCFLINSRTMYRIIRIEKLMTFYKNIFIEAQIFLHNEKLFTFERQRYSNIK